MVILQTVLYQNEMYILGHWVFFLFVIRWLFATQIDAITLPLVEYDPYES